MPKRSLQRFTLSLSALALAACGANEVAPETGLDAPNALDQAASLSLSCTGCHSGQPGAIVSLNSHTESALIEALQRYKTEADGTTVMHRLARGYSDSEIETISAYLGAPEAAE